MTPDLSRRPALSKLTTSLHPRHGQTSPALFWEQPLAPSPPHLYSHVSRTIAAPTVVFMGESCALCHGNFWQQTKVSQQPQLPQDNGWVWWWEARRHFTTPQTQQNQQWVYFCVMTSSRGGLTNMWHLNNIYSTVLTNMASCGFATICQWRLLEIQGDRSAITSQGHFADVCQPPLEDHCTTARQQLLKLKVSSILSTDF